MHAKVVIIGSGVAGGVVARELLQAGAPDVLMIEQGPRMVMRDERMWHDHVMAGREPFANVLKPSFPQKSVGRSFYPLEGKLLEVRGGSTLHWEGWSYRLKPEDFRLKTNTGAGADWPIAYEDLEPHYAEAERTLQVAGDAEDEGHPPRSGPFPLPAMPYQLSNDPFLMGMERLNYSVMHHCIARNTQPINGMPQCQTFGTCKYCPIGGRFTGDQLIDRLEAMPGFKLLTSTAVRRVLSASKQKVSGLEVFDRAAGKTFVIEADTIVVCGGGIQSPKLLLQSSNANWPRGIGNDGGKLGHYLFNHVWSFARGVLAPNRLHLAGELAAYDTVVSRHFDSAAEQKDGKTLLVGYPLYLHDALDQMLTGATVDEINAELERGVYYFVAGQTEDWPEEHNHIRLAGPMNDKGEQPIEIDYTIGAHARARHARIEKLCVQILEAMGCQTAGIFRRSDPPIMAAHHMGSCRMSTSAADGVVDETLRVHGTDNLYVCGSAVFPSGGAANPTLTIAALAHRLGKRLGATLGAVPKTP